MTSTTKSILITGCSTGFGRATVLHFVKLGWRVFATVRKEADRESLLKEAGELLGTGAGAQGSAGAVEVVLCDVVRAEDVKRLGQTVAAQTSTLDALVNNAGTAFAAPMELIPPDVLRQQLDLNVVAQVAVTQAVMPLLKAAKGTIINVSSVGGKVTSAMLGAYNASKFALEAISDVMRVEVAPFGVKVAVIEPGGSPTAIWLTSMNRTLRMLEERGIDISAYAKLVDSLLKFAELRSKEGFPAELFAETVEKIVNSKDPATRYPIPGNIGWLISARRFIPDKIWDRIVRRNLDW